MTQTQGSPSHRRERILRAAIAQGLLDPENSPLAAFIDTHLVARRVRNLGEAFPADISALHTFAVKANSIVPVLRGLRELGMGCEVASAGELAQALSAGLAPSSIVFDSPAKTRKEIQWAVKLGLALNIDNFSELAIVDSLRTTESMGSFGFRVNPQVGIGKIAAMSTAGPTSKFGVALEDPGNWNRLVEAYAQRPWMTRVHAHVGSQGCPLPLITQGIRVLVDFADQVNAKVGRCQINTIDVGGGLPVNFGSDSIEPTFAAYVTELRRAAPRLFSGDYSLVTEFGRSILAKAGFTASYVAYTKTAGNKRIAITHAGANVATRTVFMPESWPIRVSVHDRTGLERSGHLMVQDVAGPCCFAGDIVARDRALPVIEEGDVVALLDTGAYYSSTPYAYNSILEPGVYGAQIDDACNVNFTMLREPQTISELLQASGAKLPEDSNEASWLYGSAEP